MVKENYIMKIIILNMMENLKCIYLMGMENSLIKMVNIL